MKCPSSSEKKRLPITVRVLGLVLLVVVSGAVADAACAQQYSRQITVTTDQGAEQILTLGFDPAATEGIDAQFGEEELAPYPADTFDVRFREGGDNILFDPPEGSGDGPRGNGTRTDIQQGEVPQSESITYPVVVQLAEDGNPGNQYASTASLSFDFDPSQVPTIDIVDGFGVAFDTTIAITEGEQTLDVGLSAAAGLGLSYVPIDVTVNYEGAIPVEFAGAPAPVVNGNDVTLQWTTLQEVNNAGFHVEYRRVGIAHWTLAAGGLIEGAGTSTEAHTYRFTLRNLKAGRYVFRVQQVDTDNDSSYSQVSVAVEVGAAGFMLRPASPNPVSAGQVAVLRFSAPERENAKAVLYNTLGRRVRRLDVGSETIRVVPEGLASGLYFVRFTDGERTATQSLTVLR